MKKSITIIFFLFCHCSLFAQQADIHGTEQLLVRAVLEQQQLSWNRGDIEGFMQGYWQSDSLTFIGKNGVTRGWQTTLANYKKSYPDKSAMGQLTFNILEMESFSPGTVFVTGKWGLTRESNKGNIGGYFTLVFKKISGNWVIVSDHTS